jgi:hypothetical protein
MAQMERTYAMAAMTVLMVVVTVNSTGQIEVIILVEQVSKDRAATVAKALPREGLQGDPRLVLKTRQLFIFGETR